MLLNSSWFDKSRLSSEVAIEVTMYMTMQPSADLIQEQFLSFYADT